MAEKLNNFEKFERKKKSDFSPVLTQTAPDDWPDWKNKCKFDT